MVSAAATSRAWTRSATRLARSSIRNRSSSHAHPSANRPAATDVVHAGPACAGTSSSAPAAATRPGIRQAFAGGGATSSQRGPAVKRNPNMFSAGNTYSIRYACSAVGVAPTGGGGNGNARAASVHSHHSDARPRTAMPARKKKRCGTLASSVAADGGGAGRIGIEARDATGIMRRPGSHAGPEQRLRCGSAANGGIRAHAARRARPGRRSGRGRRKGQPSAMTLERCAACSLRPGAANPLDATQGIPSSPGGGRHPARGRCSTGPLTAATPTC
jgi:hypothetical protein